MSSTESLPTVDSLLASALRLPNDQRAILVERIFESFDAEENGLSPEQWEAQWGQEIDRRVKELQLGSVATVPGDEVMAKADLICDEP